MRCLDTSVILCIIIVIGYIMKYINECNVCKSVYGGGVETVLKLPFCDVVGMASEYTQHIGYCSSCGFIFTQNPFNSEQLANRYKNFSKYEFDEGSYSFIDSEDYKNRSTRQYHYIDQVIGTNSFSSVLEVGAASGYNLSLYKNKKTFGIEPSMVNCQNAKKYYDVEMFCGMFDEYMKSNTNEKFDLIFLSGVLEHIVNPRDFIEQCAVLNNEYMFIEVPTLDFLFLDEAYGLFCDEHVNYFTLESLQYLMNTCGYGLVSANILLDMENASPCGRALTSVWKKNNTIRSHVVVNNVLSTFNDYVEKSNEDMNRIRKIIDEIPNDAKLAVWGTGNCLSKLLAMTNLAEKNILRVYDSNVHKQGCFVQKIQIRRFDAKDISDNIIDTVVISSYTAQKAISKILKSYSGKIKVITLYDL